MTYHHQRAAAVVLALLAVFSSLAHGQGPRILFECSFDDDDTLCGMVQAQSPEDKMDWTRNTGNTPSGNTGPNRAAEGTHYIYTEMSGKQVNDFATIRSIPLQYSGDICVRFKYHMYGQHIGYLSVFTNSRTSPAQRFTGQQQNGEGEPWKDAAVDTSITFNQRVAFEAARSDGVFGDSAIDSIRIIAGTCANPVTIPPTDVTNPPPTVTPGQTCPNANAVDFETRAATECNSVQSNDVMNWVITSQRTESTETGPLGAASGNYYIHIEASQRRNGDTATLIMQRPVISGQVCVRFSYHMYGYHIGKLEFFTTRGGVRTIQWRLEGQQQTRQDRAWREGVVDIDNGFISEMGFIGTRGADFTGDIGLDNIRYTRGPCQPTTSGAIYSCDFELRNERSVTTMCGITQDDRTDSFDWTLKRGPTPSGVTGPSRANSGDYYIFTEATSRRQGDQANVFLPSIPANGPVCVRFAVSMFGFHMGKIEVIRRRGNTDTVVYTREGQWDNVWHDVSGTIEDLQQNDRVFFRGTRGTGYSSDLAVDKITINPNRC